MSIVMRKGIEGLRPYPPGKPIEEVQREFGVKRVVKLASNENLHGPSPRALHAVRKMLEQGNYYPDANVYILGHKLTRKLKIPPEQILFGNGSDDIVTLICMTFLEPHHNIVISDYAFIRYKMNADVIGAKVKTVPMKDYYHDVKSLAAAVDSNTKILFMDNPNNPLGTSVGKKDVEYLLENVPSHVLVVIDEAYKEYVTCRDYPHNSIALLKHYKNLMLLRTFSKAYGLAGFRIGYAMSDAYLIQAVLRVKPPFNVNAIAQAAAIGALDDIQHIKKTVAGNTTEKQRLYKELKRLRLKCLPSDANFITIHVGDAAAVSTALMMQGVIVRPLAGFGLKEFIRVTIGRPQDNTWFLKALRTILKSGGMTE